MLIERPPRIFRALFPDAFFRGERCGRTVYLTFDDGPVPEATPLVLDCLDRYGVKATFFTVGENVLRHPGLLEDIRRRGHAVGSHTMHHLQGAKATTKRYMLDVERAARLVGSPLFRPPHGWLRPAQAMRLARKYRVVMYDLVTRDYSGRLTADDVVENVRRYSRPGSVIVFHDSIKSLPRMSEALPRSIEWLLSQGYSFSLIPPPEELTEKAGLRRFILRHGFLF